MSLCPCIYCNLPFFRSHMNLIPSNLCVPWLVLVCLWQGLFHLIRERKMASIMPNSNLPNFPVLQHVDSLPFDAGK